MRFRFIDAEKVRYPLTVLCRVMEVSRWGYYAWQRREPCAHAKRDAALLTKIRGFHRASRRCYGSPRIYDDLRTDHEVVSQKRVARLMREDGLVGKSRRRQWTGTTDSDHGLPVAPNLLNRQFEAPRPNSVWSSDITQLWTPEGWLYLAIVLDLFARVVVGYALRADITRELVLEAVRMAIRSRTPDKGLIFHSDRGSQYAAADTEALLVRHAMTPSMSGVGCCYDNAVSESFFSSLKIELGDTFPSRRQGRSDVFDYIETFFNPSRRHSCNGNVSPRDCEAFFARHGRRPTDVKDFMTENEKPVVRKLVAPEGAPSRVSELAQWSTPRYNDGANEVCLSI